MSTIERRYFSGDTLAQAVMTAARHFGLGPEQVEYRQIEKRHGFIKTRRRFLIEVDPAGPARVAPPPQTVLARVAPAVPPAAAPPASPLPVAATPLPERSPPRESPSPERPRRERRPGPSPERSVAEGPAAEAVGEGLRRVCELADLQLTATIYQGDGRLEIDLQGEDRDILLEEDGEVLVALEYLVPRAARGVLGEMVDVRIDGGREQAGREEELQAMALRVAAEVITSGRPQTLARMPPAERRLVHVALADHATVVTESEGDGFYKRVTVRLR